LMAFMSSAEVTAAAKQRSTTPSKPPIYAD